MSIRFSGRETSVGLSGSIRVVGRVPKVYSQPSQVKFYRCSGSAFSYIDNGIYSDVSYIEGSGDLVGNELVAVGSRDDMVQIAYSAYSGEGSFLLGLDDCRRKDGALMCTTLVAGTRIAVKITPKTGGALLTTTEDGTAEHHRLHLIGSWQQAVSRGRVVRPVGAHGDSLICPGVFKLRGNPFVFMYHATADIDVCLRHMKRADQAVPLSHPADQDDDQLR